MSFDVPADAYGRFRGRWSEPLSAQLADLAGVSAGQHALDVGCGPGALTAELVDRLGSAAVAAVEPSPPFVAAVRARFPEVEVRQAAAEQLPYEDASFDVALAQLVVHFMADPVAGLREMARVVRPGGRVAASVWDHGGGSGPLSTFWDAVRETDPAAPDESRMPGAREGHLAQLCAEAGMVGVEETVLTVTLPFATLDDWWEPYTLGVGPAGDHVARLDPDARAALRERCARRLPPAPFDATAAAWAVVATIDG